MTRLPHLKSPFVLAPMVGVTDVAFRILCKRQGAGLVFTEMTMAESILRRQKPIPVVEEERPIALQLGGKDPEKMLKAAQTYEHIVDILDVNCGCPASKAVRIGTGASLLSKPELLARIVKHLSSNLSIPVSVKIRLGEKNSNALAKCIEESGASLLTVHGRTATQGYSGKARWDIIAKVKEQAGIPVIGNGDIFSAQDALSFKKESGVDYVMIGRAAAKNPRIFAECNALLKNKYLETRAEDKFSLCNDYLELAARHVIHFSVIKDHIVHFTKGLKGSAALRAQLMQAKTLAQLKGLLPA
ncbi:MAG: tRNA-dihydrouridine synthase family protein [archaeon]